MMFSTLSISVLVTLVATSLCSPFPLHSHHTFDIRQANNCTEYCSNSAGCTCTVRPSDCTAFYTVQPDDTCGSIATAFSNFTTTQLYRWNPDIGQTCFGLQAYVPICINTPWYTFTPPIQASYGTVETADQTPVPVLPNIISSCSEFEFVGPDQTVYEMSQQNGFPQSDFALWNGNATGPWSDYWACVQA